MSIDKFTLKRTLMDTLTFIVLPGMYAICRFDARDDIPDWVFQSRFYNISKSENELSIICEAHLVPEDTKADRDWKLMRLEGTLDLSLTGVTARFSAPLAKHDVNLCVLATYDTDYIMVKNKKLMQAQTVLRQAGFVVVA